MSLVDDLETFRIGQDLSVFLSFMHINMYLVTLATYCNILQHIATYCNIYWLWLPWFPTISHVARLLVPEPPELERGGKRPRPGRGPDIGTVGLDAISGSICYAAAPPEATAAAYCMALYGCHGELARHTRLWIWSIVIYSIIVMYSIQYTEHMMICLISWSHTSSNW